MLKFVYKEIDITPKKNVEMVGFGRFDETSKGILDSLLAQITIWKLENEVCTLIAIDHIGFGINHCEYLRDLVSKTLLIKKEKVMLCFSHTHSSFNDSLEEELFDSICKKIELSIIEIKDNLKEVKIAQDISSLDIGINRRKASTSLDDRLSITKVIDKNNMLQLILLRLSVHANVLKADNYLISSDFIGKTRELLSNQYNCPIVITQGAAGNISPKYYNSKINPPDATDERFIRCEDALFKMANQILLAVKEKFDLMQVENIEKLLMYSKTVEFESEVPSFNRALEVAKEAKMYCQIDGTNWFKEVKRLNDLNVFVQKDLVEVQYFYFGKICFCGVPNEIMCEFAIEVSNKLNDENFYLSGYTNGCTGYFPTKKEFDEGGYEVYWSLLVFFQYFNRVFPYNRNESDKLINFVVENTN